MKGVEEEDGLERLSREGQSNGIRGDEVRDGIPRGMRWGDKIREGCGRATGISTCVSLKFCNGKGQ